jgi:hypothetical protein
VKRRGMWSGATVERKVGEARRKVRSRGATTIFLRNYGTWGADTGARIKKPREYRGPPMGSSVRTDVLDKTLLFSKPLTEVNQKTVLRVGKSKHHIFQISVANRTRVLVDQIEFSETKCT